MTKGWSAIVVDIGVAYKEDTDHVNEVMKQVGRRTHERRCLAIDPYGGRFMGSR